MNSPLKENEILCVTITALISSVPGEGKLTTFLAKTTGQEGRFIRLPALEWGAEFSQSLLLASTFFLFLMPHVRPCRAKVNPNTASLCLMLECSILPSRRWSCVSFDPAIPGCYSITIFSFYFQFYM